MLSTSSIWLRKLHTEVSLIFISNIFVNAMHFLCMIWYSTDRSFTSLTFISGGWIAIATCVLQCQMWRFISWRPQLLPPFWSSATSIITLKLDGSTDNTWQNNKEPFLYLLKLEIETGVIRTRCNQGQIGVFWSASLLDLMVYYIKNREPHSIKIRW